MNVMKRLVNRFLSWPLPKGFAPDGGISFTENRSPLCWPTGTNLFDAEQARKMFEHVIGDVSDYEASTEEEGDAFMHGYFCCKEVADSELTAANERIRELEVERDRWYGKATERAIELAAERLVSDKLATAACALGVIGNGYCFCSQNRDPDKVTHEPECAELRAALSEVAAIRSKGETA